MNSNNVLKPRRKFNLIQETRRRIRSVDHQDDDSEWSFIPLKRVVNRITKDLLEKNLFLVGAKTMDPVPFTLRELLSHWKYFPCPEDQIQCAKHSHISKIPVFSRAEYKDIAFKNALHFRIKNRSCEEMIEGYKAVEHVHKTLEDHHPDGPGWKPSNVKSLEVVLDIFSSLLRDNTVRSSFRLLGQLLSSSKYESLGVDGVYAGIMHLCIRGVDARALSVSSMWRRRSQKELYSTARQYMFYDTSDLFGMIRHNMQEYRREVNVHVAAMESELRLIRMSGHHDMSKYDFKSAFFYSWNWGLYQQLSPVNQYRLRCEKPVPIENALSGYPTMFTLGKTFGNGVAASEDLKETVGSVLKDAASEIFQDARDTTSDVLGEAKQLLEDFQGEADSSLERASQLVERLTGTMEGMIETFSSLTSAFKGVFTSLASSFSSLPSVANYIPSFEKFVSILKDYIIFVNVDSPLLKSMTILSLMNNLGFTGQALHYFKELMGHQRLEVVEEGQSSSNSQGVFTSGLLSLSFGGIIQLVAGTFACLIKGASIGKSGFFSLMKSLNPMMKDIHFLGAGCVGFERIITFIIKIYNIVSEWIQNNIFGVDSSNQAFAKRVSVLTLMANYFATEAGYDSIRMNVNMRKKATTVFPMYLELSSQARRDKNLSRFVRDIESVRRNSQLVHDFITRLEAVSNFVPTMFHAQFVGEPGVGKSFLMKTFVRDIQKALYPDEIGDSVYSYNPNLEFFDGYAGQKIFIMDDCFRMQEPKHLTTLIGLITNTPVVLPMANLSDKGTQLTSDVMLSSTNTAYPIGKDVLCMEAVHRRRHMLIEVVIDPAVRDSSTGQFSMSLYRKKYREEDLPRFPHLTFNLMRPVPREWSGASNADMVTQSTSEFDELKKYAEKLRNVNVKIMTPGSKNIDPTYYFSEDNRPPEPISLPCVGWSYEQLVHNFAARYCAFRGHEQTFSVKRKYAHAEYAIAEVEALLTQSCDIPSGVEIPFTKDKYQPYQLISHLMGDVHHPYGASDPVGAKITESSGDVMPELDEIDFEQIVNDIITEQVPTALTLDEEYDRIERLKSRSRRLQSAEPVPMKNRLRVEEIELVGKIKTLIRVVPHYTIWEGWGLPRKPSMFRVFDRMKDVDDMETYYLALLSGLDVPDRDKEKHLATFRSSLRSFVYGALAHYPDMELFGEKRRRKSVFPLFFLQNLEYYKGDWHLDVSSFVTEPFSAEFLEVSNGGEKFMIPIDAAAILSVCDTFRLFCLEFADLTVEQQQTMVEDAKWRNTITGLYTFESIKESCKGFLKRTSLHCLEYFVSPISLIMKRYPEIIKWAAMISIVVAGIWAIKSLSSLFLGKRERGEDTSKFMHKGLPSLVRYRGHPTASQGTLKEAAFQSQKILQVHTRQVTISSLDGNTVLSQALMSGQFCFVNAHSVEFLEGDEFLVSIQNPSSEEVQQFFVPKRNFVKLQNSDLTCIFSPNFPVYPSVRKRLITRQEHARYSYDGDFLIASRFMGNPTLEYHQFQRKAQKILMKSDAGVTSDISSAVILGGTTTVGKSGSPVIYLSPQSNIKLVGLQAWALGLEYTPQIAVQVLTQEDYDVLTKQLLKSVGGTDCQLTLPCEIEPIDGLPTAFQGEDYNTVVGQVSDGFIAGKVGHSQIQKSIIAPLMERDGYHSTRCPAIVSTLDQRRVGEGHFLAHSLGKFVRGSLQPFLPDKLGEAREWMKNLFRSKLDKDNFRLLEFSEIVTGLREDGSNPMNLKSSPGLPFIKDRTRGKGKFDHFHINEEGELDFVREGLFEEFEQFYQDLTESKIPYALAYDFPKDELRPRDKALGTQHSPPKTRTVVCMNMYYIMAWRYLTLDFWSAMHRAADGSFPFCPGMNPEGPDWTNAFRYLDRHPNVVDFDVSNWDGYLNSELFYGAGEVVSSFLDLDPRDQRALNTILLGVQNSFIQFERWVYLKSRGMISGFPGTAEMNTSSHILLFIYVYLLLVHGHREFESLDALMYYVSFLVYGDDIIISFSDDIKHLVNGQTIAAMYSEIGYPITSGSKIEEIRESKDIWHCSFLKSTWNHLHSGIYLRKMDIEIANDLLYWCRAKEDPLEQFMLNSIDALRIVFCHGKETYDAFLAKLNRYLRQRGITPILYSYSDLYKDYMYRYYFRESN